MAKDDKVNSPSIFQRLAVTAPILGAVGIGTRRLLKYSRSNNAIGGIPATQNHFLRNFAAKIGGPSGTSIFSGDLSIMSRANPDMIKFAWEMALNSADPAKVISRAPLDAADPSSSILDFAKRNTSTQGNRVLQNFTKQLSALEVHSASMGVNFLPNMFSRARRHNFVRSNVAVTSIEDNILQQTIQNIQEHVKNIPGVETNLQMARRDGIDGAQLMLHFSGGRFGKGVALELPMELASQPGVIVHGVTQQTKRIVGRYAMASGNYIASTLKHEQFAARRFLDEVVPKLLNNKLSISETRKLVSDFNYNMIKESEWVANLPRGTIAAHDARLRLGGSRVSLFHSDYSRFTAPEADAIMRNRINGLFPSTSPTSLAKGVLSTIDSSKLWLGGYDWSRRPMQALGRGYGPSERAFTNRALSSVRKNFSWVHTKEYEDIFHGINMDVMAKVAYISESKYPQFADRALGGTLGGTGLVSTTLNDQMEHVGPLSHNLSLKYKLNDKLQALASKERFEVDDSLKKIRDGEILGYDATGHPIVFKDGMKITGGFQYTTQDEPMLRIEGTETLAPDKYMKFFGSGKFVGQATEQNELERMILESTGHRFTDAQVVLGMDELKKNRSLHAAQMITATYDYTVKAAKNRGKSLKFSVFNDSLQNMFSKASVSNIYNHDEVTTGIYNIARQAQLAPESFGRIFGAVPHVYGDDWQAKLHKLGIEFNAQEVAEINKGMAGGVGSFYYGGPGFAGGSGSVEPRVFELLQGNQYGSLGPKMAADLSHRMILANPDVVQEQSTIGSALSSILHGAKKTEGLAEYHLKNMKDKDITDVLKKGGIVHTGGVFNEISSLYVPGSNISRSLRAGEEYGSSSELAFAYRNLFEKGRSIHLGKLDREAGQGAVDSLIGELGKAYSSTIAGKDYGLARRKVVGSRYLVDVAGTEEELGDMYTRGISRQHGLNMFREMEELYAGNDQELAGLTKMRERFLAGEAIGIIDRRDPAIGPYSTQFGKVKMIPRLKDTNALLIPQKTVPIYESIPLTGVNAGKFMQGDEITRVALGPAPGFAMDFDEDKSHIMLASSTLEKDIMGHFSAGHTKELHDYENYIIRQQLLKAKAPKTEALEDVAEMTAAARKLAIAKAQVGPLSVPLREIKAGLIGHEKFSKDRLSDSLSILEAIEQNVISGKHASAAQIGDLEKQVTEVAAAARAGRGSHVTAILQDIFKNNENAVKLLNGQSMDVVVNGAKRTIKGFDLVQIGEDIATGVSNLSTESRGLTENVTRSILKGNRSLSRNEIAPFLANAGSLLSAFKMNESGSGMSSVVDTAIAMKNKVAAVGGDIISHLGKPLALGFGASLAIAAALSKPLSSTDPEDRRTPINSGRVQTSNTNSIAPENIHPDPNIVGEPTTVPPLTSPSVRYSQDDSAARIHIRGINKSGVNLSSVSNAITQRLQGNTNVNINIRDRKSSLSQQKIDSINRR
jgi:hypothetical protein